MRILITGGTGTVGSAFIREYGQAHEIAVYSRNEKLQWDTKLNFPGVKCYLGSVENLPGLLTAYDQFCPDVVIHAAAMKHVDMAERQPAQTCRVNIVGTLNVIAASKMTRTLVTVGISTDKACGTSVYGMSKYLTERCLLEADSPETRFAACRFGNVAKSNGSVIPRWLEAAAAGKELTVTDPSMCRLMISQPDAARLVLEAVDRCQGSDGGFILTKQLKAVNILDLAKQISPKYSVIGRRDGESQHESMIKESELPYTRQFPDGYIRIGDTVNEDVSTRCVSGYDSATAERMTEQEIRTLLDS